MSRASLQFIHQCPSVYLSVPPFAFPLFPFAFCFPLECPVYPKPIPLTGNSDGFSGGIPSERMIRQMGDEIEKTHRERL
jgi:hypothetical protein